MDQKASPQIAIGGIWHETNTFVRGVTTQADFRAYQYGAGDDLVARFTGVRNEVGGFIEGAASIDADVVPTLFAAAVPSGLVERSSYEAMKTELLTRLRDAGPVDAVLLALHGAMVAEDLEDPESDLVVAVRDAVGDTPVLVTLDFHANVSEPLFHAADVLLGYDTYPHVDPFERGCEAARLVPRLLAGGRPAKAFEKLPLLTAPLGQETGQEPMASVGALREECERRAEVVAVTVSPGFPYADVGCVGFSVAAYADDEADAKQAAAEIAALAWARRHEFTPLAVDPAEAVKRAVAAPRGPVVLVDVADNVGGGSPGDGTVLLAELLRQEAAGAVVVLADAEAAREAARAGEGASVALAVGGKTDDRHGDPVPLNGVVRRVTDGCFVHRGSYMTGQVTDMGTTAVIEAPVGSGGGVVEVMVTERRTMPFDAEQLRSQGVEPSQRHIIVAKAAIAWRAAYGDMAADALFVATPGACTSDLRTLPYTRVPRPIEPLDDISGEPSRATEGHHASQ